jgi:GrpB-like predicted nucleotidyltransferase (UPF0157 family)
MKKLRERVKAAVGEEIEIVPYDSKWPALFRREAAYLRRVLPKKSVGRIDHFGSTAVPGLAAKPIIDILVEAKRVRAARGQIALVLRARGYDYFWRPTFGDDVGPWYAFLIKRNKRGVRTHHIHVVTGHPVFAGHWDRLLFRDHLIAHPSVARKYHRLKVRGATRHRGDRAGYTKAKAKFIGDITRREKRLRRRGKKST